MLMYLAIYLAVYVVWYIINKVFDGRPDKYLRDKIWSILETQYSIIVSDDIKQNPLKYLVDDAKAIFCKMKGDKKHKNE